MWEVYDWQLIYHCYQLYSFHLLDCTQNVEWTYQILVDTHESAVIFKLSTVIGSWEYCHQFSVPVEFVAFLNDLMSPTYQVYVEFIQRVLNNILSKSIAYPSLILTPAWNVRIRVRPKNIAKKSFVRYLYWPFNVAQIVDAVQIRRKTTMHAQYFFINQCHDGHGIENVNKVLPDLQIVPSFT